MKQISNVTLYAVTMALMALMAVSCQKVNYFPSSDPRIVNVGRVVQDADTLRFTYPGTSIYFNFRGEKVQMVTKPNSGYYEVEIDSLEPYKIATDEAIVTLAEGLENTEHSLRLMYVVEGYDLKPEIYGFFCNELLEVHTDFLQKEKILFIGNSITCGYGVEATEKDGFSYSTENHYFTYANLTAKNLDALHHAIARSGIGVYRNYGDAKEGSEYPMPMLFDQTLLYNTDYDWDHQQFQPDIICLNLGTNDTSLDNYDVDLLRQSYSDFYARLRSLYPHSQIVLLTGSMMNGQSLEDVKTCLDAVKTEANEAGDEKVYRFDMTPQDGSLGYGADWHPSKEQQQRMADELTNFVRQITVEE